MTTIDMHMHTIASDGVHTPEEVVQMAKTAGLSGIAITDHDTVGAVAAAQAAASGSTLQVIPGVEVSTSFKGKDIHVLGYFVDTQNPLFLDRLSEQRNARHRRNERVVARLQQAGIDITLAGIEQLAGKSAGDRSVGRPHIAHMLVKLGVATSIADAFDRYLGKGGVAHATIERIDPFEGVRWIHEAGGCAVLAHPGVYANDAHVLELLERSTVVGKDGFDGLEAYHYEHSDEEVTRYVQWAQERALVVTAGSDFHGKRGEDAIHGEIGSRRISIEVLDQLQAKRQG